MQLDAGANVGLISRNFRIALGEPKLRQSDRQIRQFDGSTMKTLGRFTAVVELRGKNACMKMT